MSAINLHISGSHEAARLTQQEDSRATVLLRLTELAKHVLRGPVSLSIRVLLEQLLHHCGHDIARRYCVHTNTVLTPLRGEVTGELDDTSF